MNYFFPKEEEILEIDSPYDKQREIDLNKLYNTILDRDCKKEELDYFMRFKFSLERIEKSLINSNEALKIKNTIFNMNTWVKFCEDHTYFLKIMDFKDPPKYSKNNLVFIDFRFLNNFEFVILNALIKLDGNFMITFVCNNNNYDKVSLLCQNIHKNIKILKLENNINSQTEYNDLLLQSNFWKKLDGENILLHQFDAIIFKKNYLDFLNYEYIGSPMKTDRGIIFNGGFSFRKKSIMIKLLEKNKPEKIFEDIFFTSKIKLDINVAKNFGTQDFYFDSFGGHKFWMSKKYKSSELYNKIFSKDLTDKYPILFHKYYLNLENKNDKIEYIIRKESNYICKLVCHIHCYDINDFEYFFGKYIREIGKHFYIIITYSKGILDINSFGDVTLLNIKNKGADIGSRFCAMKYLQDKKYNYDFIMMLHSKKNDTKRDLYFKPFLQNLENTLNLLDKDTGVYCPNIIFKGSTEIGSNRIITNFDIFTRNNDWGRNRYYMKELTEYLNLPDYYLLFPEGSVYILSREVAEIKYTDKNLYNCLNTIDSFDYSWVINYYNNYNSSILSVYSEYKEKNLYGNNFNLGKGWKGLADCMLEHAFERITFGICKKINKKIHIIDCDNNNNYNKFLFTGEISNLKLKPVTIIACHTSCDLKLKALINNLDYLKKLSNHIYIVNSKGFEGKIENLLKSEDVILNDNITNNQALEYINYYEDLKNCNLSIKEAKEHYIKHGKGENRFIKGAVSVYIDYTENNKFLGQWKWLHTLEKIKNNFNSFILTNDSFIITRELKDFEELFLKDYDMVSIVDSNEGKHHYMDFLRYYSKNCVEELMYFFKENFNKCSTLLDIINNLEIESTFITSNRSCLYSVDSNYKKNIHFDDNMNDYYLNQLNYPIVKIKKLKYNCYKDQPPDFNPKEYKNLHMDLKEMSDKEATIHFKNHGYHEGRPYKKNKG